MLLNLSNISYRVGINEQFQITVSGAINEGDTLVVRGPSGAGKSTLLRILTRLQPCTEGDVFLQGQHWHDIPAVIWRTLVHYLPQKPVLFAGTVKDNLALPFETEVMKDKKKFNLDYVKKLLNDLFLPSEILNQNGNTLSGGEAARITFVRALLVNPMVLLLDEPTAALDEKSRKAFYLVLSKWLSNPARAALLISHNDDYHALTNIKYLDINKE